MQAEVVEGTAEVGDVGFEAWAHTPRQPVEHVQRLLGCWQHVAPHSRHVGLGALGDTVRLRRRDWLSAAPKNNSRGSSNGGMTVHVNRSQIFTALVQQHAMMSLAAPHCWLQTSAADMLAHEVDGQALRCGCHLQRTPSNMHQVAVERHSRGPLLVCMLVHTPAEASVVTLSMAVMPTSGKVTKSAVSQSDVKDELGPGG